MLAVRDAGTGGDGERCWVTLRNADPAYKNVSARVKQVLLTGLCMAERAPKQLALLTLSAELTSTLRPPPCLQLWGKYSKDSGQVELLTPGKEVCIPQGQDASGLYPISGAAGPAGWLALTAACLFLPPAFAHVGSTPWLHATTAMY